MPRGKRKSCVEKLEELREMISALETQLKELKTRERELVKEQKEEELRQIAEILEERNMTAMELAGFLDQVSLEEQQAAV